MSEERFDKIDRRFDKIDKRLDDVVSDVTGLKSDVTGLKSDVAGLKTDVVDLRRHMGVLHEDVIDRIRAVGEHDGLRQEMRTSFAEVLRKLADHAVPGREAGDQLTRYFPPSAVSSVRARS